MPEEQHGPQPAAGEHGGDASSPDLVTELPAPAELPGRAIGPRLRRVAVALVLARYAIPIGALALIPVLVRDQLPLLILLRPGKEILLLAGGRLRIEGEPSLAVAFLAYVPLMIVAVWAFFLVGRAYQVALRTGRGPAWLRQTVPPDRLELAQRAIARRGPLIAVLGRIGGLPPTILAAAAGVSDVSPRAYLAADAAGGVAAFGITIAVGYALGEAYEQGGLWFTVAALALVVGLAIWLNRWMQRELAREDVRGRRARPS